MTPLVAALLAASQPAQVRAVPRGKVYNRPDSVFTLIREAESGAQAVEIYLEACKEYSGASSGTKRKWERAAAARARQLELLHQVEAAAAPTEASA
jgi:hypothetical protein